MLAFVKPEVNPVDLVIFSFPLCKVWKVCSEVFVL